MPRLLTHTRRRLSELGSPDEFEALATAVLRAFSPRYASLHHVGTNVSGRAVRSPVDGISIRVRRGDRQLVLVQHTITARRDLRRKWLDQDGDLAKAKAIFDAEVARGSLQRATLVLTSNSDPDEKLIRDLSAATPDNLELDIWSASRIADFLDRNPEGQWLRQQQFGTEAVRLSASQALAISKRSLNEYLPLVERGEIIPRTMDAGLATFFGERRGAGFVIGESGLGKSAALRRLGDDWHMQGNNVLILSHEFVEQASTVDQAIALGLRHWAPSLDLTCGQAALELASPERPLLIIVEDINRSTNPRRIIERLIGWSIVGKPEVGGGTNAPRWRLLCPAWRGNAGLADTRLRDRVIDRSFFFERFERSEAVEAIRVRGRAAGVELTALQCGDLAISLGDDPLLIGVNSDWSTPNPKSAILSYIIANIDEAADDRLLAIDLRHALDKLAERLVEAKNIYPEWSEICSWFAAESDTLAAIRRLISQARVILLDASIGHQRLAYRHDRVRDHLLSQAITRLIESDRLSDELWSDPFYAELVGASLSTLSPTKVSEAETRNPVAIFAALQDASLDQTHRQQLVEAAKRWTISPNFHSQKADQQRHHAMRCLARIDGAFAADLAKRFPFSFPQMEALVRNGDARAGAGLCANAGPSVYDAWRDRMIAHALSRHSNFVPDLAELIRTGELSPKLLEGALNLAGEIGDPALCTALSARWVLGDGKSLSTGWLWATLRCCSPIKHPLADTLCNLWAELPTKSKEGDDKHIHNPRWDIAGHSLQWAFSRKPEPSAITYMIARASRDRRLSHVLNWILKHIDSPGAIIYSIKQVAKGRRRAEKAGGTYFDDTGRIWSPGQHGRTLSTQSRNAAAKVWRNRRINKFDRMAAFTVWRQTPTRDELSKLSALEVDTDLADAALKTRLATGDQSAVPLLKQRIWNTEDGKYWWFDARGIGLSGLHEDVRRYLNERRIDPPVTGRITDADYILSELLMNERDDFAVQTIIANWDHLKTSPSYVQTALYLATTETIALARSAIADSGRPEVMLKHIHMHWGIRTTGRPGVTDLAQLQALEPYLVQLSEMDMGHMYIDSFFDAANSLRALSWREKHLDPLVGRTDLHHCTSDKQTLYVSLDKELEAHLKYNRPWFAIDHWFKWREEELWERSTLLAIMGEWAFARASEPAVAFLCEALLQFGERCDLALLDTLSPSLRMRCADMLHNCIYDVRRRSLSH